MGDVTLHASWIHGNAMAVETPENLSRNGHFGWGADVDIIPGRSSWFHIAVPTPVIVSDVRTSLIKVFVLFSTDPGFGQLRRVHVWDGSAQVQQFEDLASEGDHRGGLDGQNTFVLSQPHVVAFGIGISFFVVAAIGFDTPIAPSRLILGTAGGDFVT
ncbi:DUF6623 family protein [Kitasatospora sp. NPDC005856]|uniref:DUF6623 family protein n=1 Tax=Kitasatospora sp. NPDC005856 TaxID=3154566 RepID=UPI0033D93181